MSSVDDHQVQMWHWAIPYRTYSSRPSKQLFSHWHMLIESLPKAWDKPRVTLCRWFKVLMTMTQYVGVVCFVHISCNDDWRQPFSERVLRLVCGENASQRTSWTSPSCSIWLGVGQDVVTMTTLYFSPALRRGWPCRMAARRLAGWLSGLFGCHCWLCSWAWDVELPFPPISIRAIEKVAV